MRGKRNKGRLKETVEDVKKVDDFQLSEIIMIRKKRQRQRLINNINRSQ